MIKPETVERIIDAARIEEIVGEFVSLKRRGANLLGCCPFHNEKTPSFTVSPAKGIFKCFGCGEAGNSVHFLMKHEHYSYPEALKYIAKKYSIEIEEEELSPQQIEKQTEREGLFNVSDFAQKYFSELLTENELGRNIGLAYFYERGLSDDVIKKFGLGYCLDEWENFTKHALASGYSINVLEKTGLSIVKDDGKTYDRFRGRVMFPVYSVSGRVLGFSGRILSSEKQAAKYVNSPESEIYNKSKTLYGLFQSKNSISKSDLCYLVEGNIDVITLHQCGIENVVASSGTSLTMEQIRLIHRYTKNITVLYDGDAAGIKAAMRAVNMLLEEGMSVRVVLFPEGEDPDSYARKYGAEMIKNYVEQQATNFIVFKTKLLLEETQGDPIKKAALIKDIVQTISFVPEMIERNLYVKECSALLDISEHTLATELAKCISERFKRKERNSEPQPTPISVNNNVEPNPGSGNDLPYPVESSLPDFVQSLTQQPVYANEMEERRIISLLINYGDTTIKDKVENEEGEMVEEEYYVSAYIVGDIMNDDIMFENPTYQEVFDMYKTKIYEGEVIGSSYFFTLNRPDLDNLVATMLTNTYTISEKWGDDKRRIYVPKPEDNVDKDVKEALLKLKQAKVNQKIQEVKEQLKVASDINDIMLLLNEQKNLESIRILIGKALNQIITS
ncbi:MAG: DNA primase [Bacteroidales bacterium]|nr:DNA primase [Bacteroidales bacterium]